ncbi:MAG: phenylalanine--tRNA ligase subunit alpha [Candidatus Neomarinimicrobiota bacterium]
MNLLERAEEVRLQLKNDLAQVGSDLPSVENFRIKFLGKKGIIPALFSEFATLSNDAKRQFGKTLNELKNEAEHAVNSLQERLNKQETDSEFFDFTLPGKTPSLGHLHPVTQTLNRITDIFREIGFQIEYGPEVETDYHNFQALNIPENHPARDMQDTFYIDDSIVLRTHTSPIQVRTMLKSKPPIRILAPGRVYRNEAINARSYCLFHQIEGLYVDEHVTFAELKGTIEYFAKRFFGKNVIIRFRPSFFPFTEPSAEVDVSCYLCGAKGCRVCKHTGWLEIMGCGMVDPAVFAEVGIDPEKYTGYAFGMGADRIALQKYGIDDIRLFFDGDVRFLKQF